MCSPGDVDWRTSLGYRGGHGRDHEGAVDFFPPCEFPTPRASYLQLYSNQAPPIPSSIILDDAADEFRRKCFAMCVLLLISLVALPTETTTATLTNVHQRPICGSTISCIVPKVGRSAVSAAVVKLLKRRILTITEDIT